MAATTKLKNPKIAISLLWYFRIFHRIFRFVFSRLAYWNFLQSTSLLCVFLFCFLDYQPIDNFIIGLTDTPPAAIAPTLWNYDVCAQYPGIVAKGRRISQPCTSKMPPRRYVIVQLERTSGVLNFCEINVFARRKLIFVLCYSQPNTSNLTKVEINQKCL